MHGNDKDMLEYYQKRGIHIYCENDERNKFDGKYGFLTYNKTSGKKYRPVSEWIIAVGLHPGIIEGKEWVAVQNLLEKNANKSYRAIANPKKQTIVAGLLKCKLCKSCMRARNMDKRKAQVSVNYRYCCNLKEKSRGQKCNGLNVSGEELDNKIIEIIKETSVPNSKIYEELKKIVAKKSKNSQNEELEILENAYKKNQEEIEKLVEKLKYIDIDVIDVINNKLRNLKKQRKELQTQIIKLKTEDNNFEVEKDILKIINKSFDVFDMFDLKTKRDIAGLFIEKIYGNGDDVEIYLLTTRNR